MLLIVGVRCLRLARRWLLLFVVACNCVLMCVVVCCGVLLSGVVRCCYSWCAAGCYCSVLFGVVRCCSLLFVVIWYSRCCCSVCPL